MFEKDYLDNGDKGIFTKRSSNLLFKYLVLEVINKLNSYKNYS